MIHFEPIHPHGPLLAPFSIHAYDNTLTPFIPLLAPPTADPLPLLPLVNQLKEQGNLPEATPLNRAMSDSPHIPLIAHRSSGKDCAFETPSPSNL